MLNIILNPNSGEGKKRKLQRAALERFRARGQALRVFETEKAGQATHLAHDLTQEGEGDVIVVGGDGTLHEVVNGFTNFDKCALGLIPTGTGNDFAAAAGIPLDPVKAADLIVDSQPQYTEYMQMPQGVRGINAVGTGIDVEILQRCRFSKILRGRFQYLISLIISLIKFKNYKMRTLVNGKEGNYNALIACVGNGYRIGGGIRMCPAAKLGDGLLDFVLIKAMPRIRIPGFLKRYKRGLHVGLDICEVLRGTAMRVTSREEAAVNLDGECFRARETAFAVEPGRIPFVLPQ